MSTDVTSKAEATDATETSTAATGSMADAIAALDLRIRALEAKSKKLSAARMLLFLAVLVGLFGAAESSLFPLGIALPSLIAFIFVLYRHGAVLDAKKILELDRLLRFEKEERRTNRRRSRAIPDVPDSGTPLERGLAAYREEPAAYSLDDGVVDDLGVLSGPRNLFSVLDVTSTEFGARRLRHLLTHVLDSRDEIQRRQAAVAELGQRTTFREKILEALIALREAKFDGLPRFFHSPTTFAGRSALRWSAHVLGSIVPLCVLLACLPDSIIGGVRAHLLAIGFFTILINMAMIGSRVRETNPARDRLRRFGPLFSGMSRLDAALLEAKPESPALAEIASTFEELRPKIGKLERYVALLGLHEFGVIFEILNVVLLWELRVLPPAETIFRDHRELLERSTGALGEIEALCSLACALDEQIGYTIPAPVDGDRPRVLAKQLGHPLLESDVVVRNDLEIGKDTTDGISVVILSGSRTCPESRPTSSRQGSMFSSQEREVRSARSRSNGRRCGSTATSTCETPSTTARATSRSRSSAFATRSARPTRIR